MSRNTYSRRSAQDSALAGKLSHSEAPPEPVDCHQVHGGVEAEQDEDWEVEVVLRALR